LVAKKNEPEESKKRPSGPRAPPGKHALTVIIGVKTIEEAKIAAIQDKTNVSRVVEKLLQDWLMARKTRR
jgi:hypothetical protein